MTDRVVHFDDLPIEIQGVGDVHALAQHKVAKGAGDAGLSISGRSIHKDG